MDAAAAARDGQTALALRLAKHLAPPPATAGGADDDHASARGCVNGNGNGNVAFSPVSVYAALALVAAGARSATLGQLLAFLGAPSAEGIPDFSRRVGDRVLADRSDACWPRVLFGFGGGVWVDESRGRLADAFRDVAADVYKSEARTVCEDDQRMGEEGHGGTDNLIGSIISIDDINNDVDLVLTNAIYFKGAWQHQFRTHATRRGAFHRLNGVVAEPEFMMGSKWLDVVCMDGFKVLKLPYKPGDAAPASHQLKRKRRRGASKSNKAAPSPEADEHTRYSMFVFLPDARDGLCQVITGDLHR
ncbi:hypothetical protein U9M48_002114 [Paspalum notatum var. saurae]|uniref:Serpin domain-containing protein n=1 Tax=Paspalum notatum var. saurae TaxID=547442 RepID=A0AAQ3PNB2_PASNO